MSLELEDGRRCKAKKKKYDLPPRYVARIQISADPLLVDNDSQRFPANTVVAKLRGSSQSGGTPKPLDANTRDPVDLAYTGADVWGDLPSNSPRRQKSASPELPTAPLSEQVKEPTPILSPTLPKHNLSTDDTNVLESTPTLKTASTLGTSQLLAPINGKQQVEPSSDLARVAAYTDASTSSSRPHSSITVDRKSLAYSVVSDSSTRPIPPSEAGDAAETDDDAASSSSSVNAIPTEPSKTPATRRESSASSSLGVTPAGPLGPDRISSESEGGNGLMASVESVSKISESHRYNYDISVGDPQKTDSPSFRNKNVSVVRRYRDFLWLYTQLLTKYPGIVVPPVPEKAALGRFSDDFVESRRGALERFLRRTASHPILSNESDMRLFLESETFNVDVNQKKKEETAKVGGLFGRLGQSLTVATPSFSKVVEVDQWFDTKKTQIDLLDGQLKALLKALEGLVKQRRELALGLAEFGESMLALAQIEVNKPLAFHLTTLGDIHKRLREVHERQAKLDMQSLVATTDEYIRIIASMKKAFEARVKSYQVWQQLDANLTKKLEALEKMKTAKGRQDKRTQLGTEIDEAEKGVDQAKRDFEEISKLLRSELARFDVEKVADFTDCMRQFLKDFTDTQDEIISLWESYFSRISQYVGSPISQQPPTQIPTPGAATPPMVADKELPQAPPKQQAPFDPLS
ncbi:hypothetical protein SmJEL517_g01340 [Synchytrium microbalum]|uniref:PX domain-containing protein n=1 Tax=Synchytrium microbalum TaxID=1806994 RepID=A0A507CGB7_9FUNG|nr:uncharacterized protein SmJEL517_g01340 [Synchytrium microbalum]TPX36655.1 hypothetical protein SmJEL517_g01340 [Synchytrium microbalum]